MTGEIQARETSTLPEAVLKTLREIIADCDTLSAIAKDLRGGLKDDEALLGVLNSIKLRGAWLRSECFKASTEPVFHNHPEIAAEVEPHELHTYHHERRHPRLIGKAAAANDDSLRG